MKRSEQDRLLGEVFADENVERLRATSLAGALTAVRKRRRRRAIVSAGAASLAVVMTALVLSHRESRGPAAATIPTEALRPTPPPQEGRIKIINDEELLALFPDRNVALVGEPGAQRLMFLDGGASPAAKAGR